MHKIAILISQAQQEQKQDKKSKNVSGKGSSRLQNDDTASGPSSGGVKVKLADQVVKSLQAVETALEWVTLQLLLKAVKKLKKVFLVDF